MFAPKRVAPVSETFEQAGERIAHVADRRPVGAQGAVDLEAVALLVAPDGRIERRSPIARRPVRRGQVKIAAVGENAFEPDRVLARIRLPASDAALEI